MPYFRLISSLQTKKLYAKKVQESTCLYSLKVIIITHQRRVQYVKGIQPIIIIRHNNLHILVDRLRVPYNPTISKPCSNKSYLPTNKAVSDETNRTKTCFGIIDGPQAAPELDIGQEDADPSTDHAARLLALGVEDGAADAGDEEDGFKVGTFHAPRSPEAGEARDVRHGVAGECAAASDACWVAGGGWGSGRRWGRWGRWGRAID